MRQHRFITMTAVALSRTMAASEHLLQTRYFGILIDDGMPIEFVEEPIQNQEFDPHKLRYYQDQQAKRTMVARVALLGLIFAMLAGNIWLTQNNHEALVTNLNQTRLDQVALNEKMTEELRQMRSLLESYESRVVALEATERTREAVAEAQ